MTLYSLVRGIGAPPRPICHENQYQQKAYHQRLGSGVHTEAIMDRVIHYIFWIETGGYNLCEKIGAV